MNDIHTIQPSVNGINEVGLYLKKESEPPFAVHIQKELDELNRQWENVCKQVRDCYCTRSMCLPASTSPHNSECLSLPVQAYAKKSALKGGLDKTMALRKEMQEMQEWINQAEEDYLERDFTYKTPEELRKAVEELKVCETENKHISEDTHTFTYKGMFYTVSSVVITQYSQGQQILTYHILEKAQ